MGFIANVRHCLLILSPLSLPLPLIRKVVEYPRCPTQTGHSQIHLMPRAPKRLHQSASFPPIPSSGKNQPTSVPRTYAHARNLATTASITLLIKPAQVVLWRPTFAEPAPPVIRRWDRDSENAGAVAVFAHGYVHVAAALSGWGMRW